MTPAAQTRVKKASMSAWHCSRLKRLCIGTSPMSATVSCDGRRDAQHVLVGPDALDGAHRARAEPRAGRLVTPRSIGTPTSATSRPPKSGSAGASGRNGAPSSVAGSANGHLRRSAPEKICAATAANSGSWMSPPLASAYLWRSASSFLLSKVFTRGF